MTGRIVFLDIDGVLCVKSRAVTYEQVMRGGRVFAPRPRPVERRTILADRVERLNGLCQHSTPHGGRRRRAPRRLQRRTAQIVQQQHRLVPFDRAVDGGRTDPVRLEGVADVWDRVIFTNHQIGLQDEDVAAAVRLFLDAV